MAAAPQQAGDERMPNAKIYERILKNARDEAEEHLGLPKPDADNLAQFALAMSQYLRDVYPGDEALARTYLVDKFRREGLEAGLIEPYIDQLLIYRGWLLSGRVNEDEAFVEPGDVRVVDVTPEIVREVAAVSKEEEGLVGEENALLRRKMRTGHTMGVQRKREELETRRQVLNERGAKINLGGKRRRTRKNRKNRTRRVRK
jgi:hypothetical protein